jgi:hypothetical protein
MGRIRVGDRIRTPHPAGHYLLGEVMQMLKRSAETKARYAVIRFVAWSDRSQEFTQIGKPERVAIELLEVVEVLSTIDKTSDKVRKKAVVPSIDAHVIELGKRLPQTLAETELDPSSLTAILPPKPGGSIAVSTIYPASTGWVECKIINGRNYYYLRGNSSPQRYLGSTWAKAIDRLPSFLDRA